MKLSEFKNHLSNVNHVNIVMPNGTFVPSHFHITEAGLVTKHFIDCGGTVRIEKAVNFQVWTSNDINHRIEPNKLLKIISLYEELFDKDDLDIEIEYQMEFSESNLLLSSNQSDWQTIGKYGLAFENENFLLTAKHTDCLAKDNCGVPQDKMKLQLTELETSNSCCAPGGSCC